MTAKSLFADKMRTQSNELYKLMREWSQDQKAYNDEGWASDGADPITDADLSNYNFTATELGEFVDLQADIYQWLFNQKALVQGDFVARVNKIRDVSAM